MQKKDVKWIVILLLLVAVSFWLNRGRFEKPHMVINPSLRPARRADAAVWPVFFSLNDSFKLTSVKVVPWDGDKFNPLGPPVWWLTTDSNSAPVRAFRYGERIKGMKPEIASSQPGPLQPDVKYRIMLEAGSIKTNIDFSTRAATP